MKKIISISIEHPLSVIALMTLVTGLCLFQFPKAHIDTDPENMLEENQGDRIFYDQIKRDFGIRDLIVLGIIDDDGIFRPETLNRIARITDAIVDIDGVVAEDVISFTTTDNVTSEAGLLKVSRIMGTVPRSDEEMSVLKTSIFDNPLLVEKIVAENGEAVALYIPIQQKDLSFRIAQEIEAVAQEELGAKQRYYIAGLPVAENTFGFEMFVQMGVLAPVAGLAIFLLLLLLFRVVPLVVPPMMVALYCVIWGMGALVGLGFTVHIMSSMIPVFLMPIAVLDSVHILSEFYDRYPALQDRKRTLLAVIDELYKPMLFTSLTSAAGFASLIFVDIPPVRVFGAFVALGIMAAWLLSMTLIPASIMLIREEKLSKRIAKRSNKFSWVNNLLPVLGRFAFARARIVLLGAVVLLVMGTWGLTKIVINDNPVNWFDKNHQIRVADRVMNERFGGTYMAYLTFEGQEADAVKRPEVLTYIAALQQCLEKQDVVGKTSSVADIVMRVGDVLHSDISAQEMIPQSREAIGQYLFLFLMSGDPNDLDNFVDYDYRKANVWVQMKRGDNQDMEQVEAAAAQFFEEYSVPEGIEIRWSGLTYINKVWQDLMVKGMLKAVLGGFAAVFILMLLLFRSLGLALIAMLPLTFAIGLSYGLIGFVGKEYDMPIAVCSSLALGLSIDFAIHFIQRFRQKYQSCGDLAAANHYVFQEPARSIVRNMIVIVLGFLPLMLSNLTPYVTVGAFFAMMMLFSGFTTLLVLPALLRTVGYRFIKI